jgi:uncharacterized C2H2 Zn-finger protein
LFETLFNRQKPPLFSLVEPYGRSFRLPLSFLNFRSLVSLFEDSPHSMQALLGTDVMLVVSADGVSTHAQGVHMAVPGRRPRDACLSGPRGFGCVYCGKWFVHQPSLIRHRRQCEGNYYLSCSICGKKFHRRDRYQSHLLRAHNAYDSAKGTFRTKYLP